MKLKYLILFFCLSIIGQGFAISSQHYHPKSDSREENSKGNFYPGYCQIEIFNNSYQDVTVYGEFDDGAPLEPFNLYSFEEPHYISLYYYRYCHRDMFLSIVTFDGFIVYSGYAPSNSTLTIVPYLTNQIKAEIKAK